MIRLFFGNIGSGKSACAVREIVLHRYKDYPCITNIRIEGVKRVIPLKIEMIIEQYEDEKGKLQMRLNETYWKELKKHHKHIDVVIDEAHLLLNARRAMSKINIITTDWMALLRRIVGSHGGTLTLITQLERRLDVITREMATSIYHHRAHWLNVCPKGCHKLSVNSDMADIPSHCHQCLSEYEQKEFMIEVSHFSSMREYETWIAGLIQAPQHFLIHDIEKFFPLYDTLQWEDLVSSLY